MKRILKLVSAIVALIVIAAIALPMFISADFLKAQLQEQVKKATGRELVIKGKASLSVFPNIAIHVEDVTLGNPAGFESPYLVHIAKLETGAALGPLLSKQLRISGITLEGAKLYLEQQTSGAKNWDFAGAKPAAAEPEEKATGEQKSPLKQLAIGRVTVKNTDVYFSKPGAKPIAAENINIALDGADGSGPLSLNGSVDYQKQPVQFSLDVKEMKALLAGKTAAVRAGLKLPSGSTANFDGELSTHEGPNGKGKFGFTSDNLGGLIGWATGNKPAGNLPKKVNVQSNVALTDAQTMALEGLSFSVDSLSGAGKLALKLGGAVPAVNGELKLGVVNLNELTGNAAAAPAAEAGKAAPASGSAGWSDAPLNLSGLRAVNANLKLAIEKLISGKLEFTDIATDIALNGGNAKITLGNMSLYGGAAKGTVGLDGSGAGAGLATNLTLSNVDIEKLMTAMSGASRLEGIANLVLTINGRGASQRALVSALGGGGNFKINDGAIKGINVASFLRDAKKGFILSDSSTESTDFTEMTASYSIAQGVVSNKDLSMKSPVLRLGGSGSVSLPARTINYRAVPTLVSSLKGQGATETSTGLDIPLLITGPWSAISITPDLEGILTNALTNPDALKDNIKGVKEGLKNFNSPKDIGKALLGGTNGAAPAPAATPATSATPTTSPKPAKEQLIEDAIGGVLGGFGK